MSARPPCRCTAPGKQTVGLFHHQSGSPASLVVGTEVGHDVGQLDAALFVGVTEDRLNQHRLVGVAHIHLAHHLQEEFLAVGIVDEGPAVLFGVALSVSSLKYLKVRCSLMGTTRSGTSLPPAHTARWSRSAHPPGGQTHLGDHPGGLVLPVEDVHQLVVGGIHRPVDEGFRLFPFGVEGGLGGLFCGGGNDLFPWAIFLSLNRRCSDWGILYWLRCPQSQRPSGSLSPGKAASRGPAAGCRAPGTWWAGP